MTWRTPYLTDDEADAIADGLHDEAIERMAEREQRLRHPVTGRFMAGDCERDCLDHCAGLCGADEPGDDDD